MDFIEPLEPRQHLSSSIEDAPDFLEQWRNTAIYSPSRPFNPDANIHPSQSQIRTDLQRIYDAGFRGLVTYTMDNTMANAPRIAKEIGFEFVGAGLFWYDNAQLAREETNLKSELSKNPSVIDAVYVGNEGLLFNRYSFNSLKSKMNEVKSYTGKPVTTSEITEKYYQFPELGLLGDFVSPNEHPYNRFISDPLKAVEEFNKQYAGLESLLPGRDIIVKETFWPTKGAGGSEENQAAYFKGIAQSDNKFIFGEAFDQYWKREPRTGQGPNWGLWDSYGNEKSSLAKIKNSFLSPYELDAKLEDGILYIKGTPGNDFIRTSDASSGKYLVRMQIRPPDNSSVSQWYRAVFNEKDIFAVHLDSGDGNDFISMSEKADPAATILGGSGNDTIHGTDNADLIYGGPGDDLIHDHGGYDTVFGEAGNDRIIGGKTPEHRNRFYGGAGNDVISSERNGSIDLIFGGEGTDRVFKDFHDILKEVELLG